MDQKTYFIGSVVEVQDVQMLIIGATFAEENNRYVKYYYAVPFPTGLTKRENCRMIHAEEVKLISEGWNSPLSGVYQRYMDIFSEMAEHFDAASMKKEMKKISKEQ